MIFNSFTNEDYFKSNFAFLNDSNINDNNNQFNYEEEDYNNYQTYEKEKEPINSTYFYMNNDLALKKIIPIEESSTKAKTLLQNIFNNNYNSQIKDEEKITIPQLYTCDTINKILSERNLNNIKKKFLIDEKLRNEEKELFLSQKKRKRTYTNEDNETKTKYQKGRKNKNDQSKRKHNKMSPDNVIKKIKSKIFEMILLFVNSILNVNNEEENNKILKDLDYKYINQLNKVIDLGLLDLPLKDLLSKDISPKFTQYDEKYNRKIIEKIEKENNNEIINFVFNMTFREWLDLFTLKKKVTEFGNLSEDKCKEIEKKLPKLQTILDEIMEKNNEENNNYYSHYIFYLFNYEIWFFNKRERKQKEK